MQIGSRIPLYKNRSSMYFAPNVSVTQREINNLIQRIQQGGRGCYSKAAISNNKYPPGPQNYQTSSEPLQGSKRATTGWRRANIVNSTWLHLYFSVRPLRMTFYIVLYVIAIKTTSYPRELSLKFI